MIRYLYGFQGQEKDDEIKGPGNSINYKYRMHDPRLGRFFAVDPLFHKFPYMTPYQFAGNKPVWSREIEGLESEKDAEQIEQKPDLEDEQFNFSEIMNDLLKDLLFREEDESLPESVKEDLPFRGREPREVRTPDAFGGVITGDFVAGGGGSQAVGVVYIKGEGLAVVGNTSGGLGWQVEGGGQVFVAWSSEEKPTLESYASRDITMNGGMSVMSASYFADYDELTNEFGDTWEGVGFGFAVGPDDLYTPINGSIQTGVTYVIWDGTKD